MKILTQEIIRDESWPDWYDGKRIDELMFCQNFLAKYPMKCIRDRLFTVDGAVEDERQISLLILQEICDCVAAGLAKLVSNLLASIKLLAYSPPLPIETDRIHVANGTYFMDGQFSSEKTFCNNRLTVAYRPDAPPPKRWLRFLSELLHPEDIPTLQEYLGYCLLPITKGQKMLMLIGKGGEGKSRIGLVMHSIFGDNMNTTSIQQVENNRFSRADLENKLLMVDDDMDMNALPKTNYIKSIVTSECKMDMERKGVQSYQSQLYVRFLCFGNEALTALHDRSDAFFRRQIVLTTKDKPAGRTDDPFLSDKLIAECESIFLWCLNGLHRLLDNDYHFTISDRARENISIVVRETITSWTFWPLLVMSNSKQTVRPVRGTCMPPIRSGAKTTLRIRFLPKDFPASLHRTPTPTVWSLPTTCILAAADGAGVTWESKW